MSSSTIKERIIPTFIGIVFLSFAIALLIKINLGVSSWDAFYANLSITTGLSFGFFSYSVGFILILLNTVVSKKKFNWSAFIVAFLIGNCVDIFNTIFEASFDINLLTAKIVLFIVGVILYGLGIAFLIFSNLPSPLEEYQFAIKKIFKVSIGTAKCYSDVSAFIAAIFVGLISNNGLGQISIGTVVITLVVGKIIDKWLVIMNSYNKRVKIKSKSIFKC